MKYHSLLFSKIGKMSPNLSSAAVVIGTFRVKIYLVILNKYSDTYEPSAQSKDSVDLNQNALIRVCKDYHSIKTFESIYFALK